jgi:hypothetical protein
MFKDVDGRDEPGHDVRSYCHQLTGAPRNRSISSKISLVIPGCAALAAQTRNLADQQ